MWTAVLRQPGMSNPEQRQRPLDAPATEEPLTLRGPVRLAAAIDAVIEQVNQEEPLSAESIHDTLLYLANLYRVQ